MTFPVYWGQCSRCHRQGTMATRLLTWYPSLCPQLWPSAQVKEARLTPRVCVCEEIKSCVFSHRICCFVKINNSEVYYRMIMYLLFQQNIWQLFFTFYCCFARLHASFFFCIYVKPDVSDVGGKKRSFTTSSNICKTRITLSLSALN